MGISLLGTHEPHHSRISGPGWRELDGNGLLRESIENY
ncbi:hypothetical protein FOPG_20062 [Fusarium oxysporum f. sp. conglutinans race 2 54008]|uniref:Uncharacterized protein n=1 Tax=Fusarium oxysporum f. sp. conglutinans race 2 54008 TaxID=1089457 RepID=X0GUZ2_FUSOX|nr:hypothetical protein FOPG_20062 [Fusarium oxysporum f. sp. conglutinans race 2 54008]